MRKIIFTLSLLFVAALMYGQTTPPTTPPAPRTGSTMPGRPHWQPGERNNMGQGGEHMKREEALKRIDERLAKVDEREAKLREMLEKAHQERQDLLERRHRIEVMTPGSNVDARPMNGGAPATAPTH